MIFIPHKDIADRRVESCQLSPQHEEITNGKYIIKRSVQKLCFQTNVFWTVIYFLEKEE